MRNISNITGQELPSTSKLLWSTLLALIVAVIVLLIAVLPAEYGLDPTGLGKKIGLTALHQPEKPEAKVVTPDQTSPTAIASQTLQKRSEKWRSNTLKLTLPANQGLEVKALIDQGERFLFQWTVSSGTLDFDMHGNVVGAAEDDYTSYWLGEGQSQAAGTFEAPFSGLHGWYWENKSEQAVTITLELEGYYKDLVQH